MNQRPRNPNGSSHAFSASFFVIEDNTPVESDKHSLTIVLSSIDFHFIANVPLNELVSPIKIRYSGKSDGRQRGGSSIRWTTGNITCPFSSIFLCHFHSYLHIYSRANKPSLSYV